MAIKADDASLSLTEVHQKLEPYFESHRVLAYEAILAQEESCKSQVELVMAKAYLTFASSTELEDFPHGGTSFISEFRKQTTENLVK